ncbi:MAG: beta strand repeat-containing protein [Candidatus Acidiferrales bacterium]
MSLLLALAGCNGGGNGGGGGSNEVSVAVSPIAAVVQLNQTVQMAAAVMNAPSLMIAASNGAVRTSNVVTITTTAAHGFAVGQFVTIQGVTDSSFLGTFAIASVPSPTTFTYAQNGSDASSGGGTIPQNNVRWQVNGTEGGSAATGTITPTGLYTAPSSLPPSTQATIATNGAVRDANTVTITTTAAHSFVVGQVISILGVTDPPPITATITASGAVRAGNNVTITTTAAHNFVVGQIVTISGVTDAGFNGAFAISSVPSTTTFRYFQSAADASSGGGTASAPVTTLNGTFLVATVPSSTTFTYSQTGSNVTSGGGIANSSAVKITAVSAADTSKTADASIGLDSGITLSLAPTSATLATNEFVQFTATASGGVPTTVNWSVNDVAGGNTTVGMIDASGLYTAPAAVPTPAVVTIKAQAAADPTKTVTATASIFSATQVLTLDTVWPTVVAQGSVFQDFYLTGTNFLSTTVVRFNGVAVPATAVTTVSSTLLRVRIPGSTLSAAGASPLDLTTQGGASATPAVNITVTAQRPALVGPSPDSLPAGVANTTFNFNGGYYSTSTAAEFDNAQPLGPTQDATDPTRRLQATITAPGTPGLYAVTVRNAGAAPSIAGSNLAIQATAAAPATVNVAVGNLPSAVAVNTATGTAVVLNRGDATISLIDLATDTVTNTYAVGGTMPTGVAVDNVRNLAVVANNGSNDISVIDLATGALVGGMTIPSPNATGVTPAAQLKPLAVAVNPVTGLALIVNTLTSAGSAEATVLDLNTGRIGTVCLTQGCQSLGNGPNASVAVEPRLNWGVITPGGAGPVTIVDLGAPPSPADPNALPTPRFVANLQVGVNVRGVAVNTETRRVFLTDPTTTTAQLFSLLDQAAPRVTGNTAPTAPVTGDLDSAVNPFTNVGVTVNSSSDMASLFDLCDSPPVCAPNRVLAFAAGSDPVAVEVDPGSNKAVIANEGSNNVTIATLGAIRPLHVLEVNPPQPIVTTPAVDLPITVTGFGFTGASVVRADETPLATTAVSSRRLTATIPAAMLGQARRLAIDVLDGGTRSNAYDIGIIQAIAVGDAPVAVGIDAERDIAVVTNSGADSNLMVDTVSLIDVDPASATYGMSLTPSPVAVGDNPQGVGIFSRRGTAVVSNRDSNEVSVIDIDLGSMTFGTVKATTAVGSEPIGVGIDEQSGQAVVANSGSSTVSVLDAFAGGGASLIAVSPDVRPVAVAIDPVRNQAAVASTATNSIAVVSLASSSVLFRISSVSGANGVVYDPVSDRFIATAALGNNIFVIDPVARTAQTARVGINPTSIAYNANASTLVTVNTASNSVSVMDFLDRRIRAVLPIAASDQGAVAIHPRTNVAIIADTANDRILLVQLPR